MDGKGKGDRGRRRNNGRESEDGGAEMENCRDLCEGEYGKDIAKIEEVSAREKERRGFQRKNRKKEVG